MVSETPSKRREVLLGVALGIALHAIFIVTCLALHNFAGVDVFFPVFLLAGTQWVYMLPAMLILRAKNRPNMLPGLLLAAVLAIVLNAVLWIIASGDVIY